MLSVKLWRRKSYTRRAWRKHDLMASMISGFGGMGCIGQLLHRRITAQDRSSMVASAEAGSARTFRRVVVVPPVGLPVVSPTMFCEHFHGSVLWPYTALLLHFAISCGCPRMAPHFICKLHITFAYFKIFKIFFLFKPEQGLKIKLQEGYP